MKNLLILLVGFVVLAQQYPRQQPQQQPPFEQQYTAQRQYFGGESQQQSRKIGELPQGGQYGQQPQGQFGQQPQGWQQPQGQFGQQPPQSNFQGQQPPEWRQQQQQQYPQQQQNFQPQQPEDQYNQEEEEDQNEYANVDQSENYPQFQSNDNETMFMVPLCQPQMMMQPHMMMQPGFMGQQNQCQCMPMTRGQLLRMIRQRRMMMMMPSQMMPPQFQQSAFGGMIPSRRMFMMPIQQQQQGGCSVVPTFRQNRAGGIILTPEIRRALRQRYMLNRMPYSACPAPSTFSGPRMMGAGRCQQMGQRLRPSFFPSAMTQQQQPQFQQFQQQQPQFEQFQQPQFQQPQFQQFQQQQEGGECGFGGMTDRFGMGRLGHRLGHRMMHRRMMQQGCPAAHMFGCLQAEDQETTPSDATPSTPATPATPSTPVTPSTPATPDQTTASDTDQTSRQQGETQEEINRRAPRFLEILLEALQNDDISGEEMEDLVNLMEKRASPAQVNQQLQDEEDDE